MRVVADALSLTEFPGATLVPTMGALHAGHLALIARARECAPSSPVIVSIFVNPKQFGPGEDFERYPRSPDTDLAATEAAGVDAVFMPSVDAMYPGTEIPTPPLPAVATEPGLEDACRPGHFAGVCRVVARLFDLAQPRIAVFGLKDYQQWRVVNAMVCAAGPRWGDLRLEPVDTVREPDGLAMSSRNVHLDPAARGRALGLSRALRAAQATPDPADAESLMRVMLNEHALDVEYAVVRDEETLGAPSPDRPRRGFIAARLGAVRLLDTMAM